MKKALVLAGWVIAHGSGAFAHDMFLVVPDHDVPAHQELTVALYNGTFEASENTIERERMADVSLANPTLPTAGETLEALVLVVGEPVPEQLVYAGHEGYHAHGDDGSHREAVQACTDEAGVVRVEVSRSGRWYLRPIHMAASDDPGIDYVSLWATLTFEVR